MTVTFIQLREREKERGKGGRGGRERERSYLPNIFRAKQKVDSYKFFYSMLCDRVGSKRECSEK